MINTTRLYKEHLTDLKAILHSKRANIFYLEKYRQMQKPKSSIGISRLQIQR